jgi:hypothetical protein
MYEIKSFEGFPTIVPGWPDAEENLTHEDYLEWALEQAQDMVGETDENEDVVLKPILSYRTWVERGREDVCDDIEFSHLPCDLCGDHLGGARHKMSALPENPAENQDFISLEVCSSCLMYALYDEEPE